MNGYYFCTYFDQNYCARGLALYHSIRRHVASFRLVILCLDDETYEILERLSLPDIDLVRLHELESRDPALFASKANRSLIEYYFTLTSAFILDTVKEHPEIDVISYIDADMYLFAPVEPVYAEMGDSSILIISHHFPDYLAGLDIYGRYNVGYLSFRSDEEGISCLKRWREQCIEWCYDRLEGERFADQKYLDQWPGLYKNLTDLSLSGVNTAPWNAARYSFSKGACGSYYLDGHPLILYHFHGLKKLVQIGRTIVYDMNLNGYLKRGSIRQVKGYPALKEMYRDYLLDLTECGKIIRDSQGSGAIREKAIRYAKETRGMSRHLSAITQGLRTGLHLFRKVVYQDIVTITVPAQEGKA